MAKYYIAVAYGYDEGEYITSMPKATKKGAIQSLKYDFTYDQGSVKFVEIDLEKYEVNLDKIPVIKVCTTKMKGKQ